MQLEAALTACLIDCLEFGPIRGPRLMRLRWREMEEGLRRLGETGWLDWMVACNPHAAAPAAIVHRKKGQASPLRCSVAALLSVGWKAEAASTGMGSLIAVGIRTSQSSRDQGRAPHCQGQRRHVYCKAAAMPRQSESLGLGELEDG